MTATTAPPAAPPDGLARENLMAGLTALAIFYRTHPDAELPDGRTLSKRVYGITYGDRIVELQRIADSWQVEMETAPDGTKLARKVYGSVQVAATVSPPDASLEDYLARIAQRRAGTEAA